ncbi:unnamed protein product [Lota lota]
MLRPMTFGAQRSRWISPHLGICKPHAWHVSASSVPTLSSLDKDKEPCWMHQTCHAQDIPAPAMIPEHRREMGVYSDTASRVNMGC